MKPRCDDCARRGCRGKAPEAIKPSFCSAWLPEGCLTVEGPDRGDGRVERETGDYPCDGCGRDCPGRKEGNRGRTRCSFRMPKGCLSTGAESEEDVRSLVGREEPE